MGKLEINEAIICQRLNSYFVGNCRYKLSNAFIFKGNWESDFFVQKQNGYAYEFEVKISRSDFFNDKKKVDKHLILSTGKYTSIGQLSTWENGKWEKEEKIKEYEHDFRPNRFFYVVPEGMITIDELPAYAGLFYYGEGADYSYNLKKVKDAPFIHKQKLSFESVLCNKFYNYWLAGKIEIRDLKAYIEELKNPIPHPRTLFQDLEMPEKTG